jgi:hypothetical protein
MGVLLRDDPDALQITLPDDGEIASEADDRMPLSIDAPCVPRKHPPRS